MVDIEEILFYFYITWGVTSAILLALFILICVLFVKVNLLSADGSNQLSRQANMMADFCYTNPTIVPGEELSRRGFSMYRGVDHSSNMFGLQKQDYTVYQEGRSKF
ncbi:uncharacterized protein [Venturia canescens]|uniref:uncharacterized protein isoform X2 n=1 Tax=Venturia canescens TaxID=32260 RepID=UPI001C9D02A9|nr:uncharacterized protein LOC122415444 isoform X2 [Venturia canescens]